MPLPQISKRAVDRVSDSTVLDNAKYYEKDLRPDGLISLATAENSLMSKELIEYMHGHFELTPDHLKYRSSLLRGVTQSVVDVMPRFLNGSLKPLIPLTTNKIVVGPGIGAILAQLLWHLCDVGDGVLMTAPYYADYPRDIVYPAQAVPVIVDVPVDVDSLSVGVIPHVRRTIEEHQAQGGKVTVIIVSNPHNPLARAYPPETILEYASIAEEFNIHLIVDEVFANEIFPSTYTPDPIPFTSILALTLPSNVDPSRIHVLAGPTKDFGASGIKVGTLISVANDAVLRLVNDSLGATPISAASDALFAKILGDEDYCDWFLGENRLRLRNAFELVAGWCEFHQLPFEKAQAGVFLLVDLGPAISAKYGEHLPVQDQVQLAILGAWKAGVLIRSPSHHADPILTRFRLVFSLPEEVMKLALYRLEEAFDLNHWTNTR